MIQKGFKITGLLLFFFCFAQAQQPQFGKAYTFKKSSSIIEDKNFYLLTLFETSPQVSDLLAADTLLNRIQKERISTIRNSLTFCKDSIPCFTQNLYWTDKEIDQVTAKLKDLYNKNLPLKNMVKDQMRSSGYFVLYQQLSDQDLLLQSWKDAAKGMNYILKAYTESAGLRYPKVDSVTYPVNSPYYRNLIREMFAQLRESSSEMNLFFQPNLKTALELLVINNRDEAARYEPLSSRENKKAYERIGSIKWTKYPYAVILIPGEGPENNMPLSPNTRYRCLMGADRYKKGLAPFLIVSGGHVHPAQTEFAEAIEMKKYLMEVCLVPEEAIIIEPHARHTTTNFRNATRIMARQGIPTDKKSLVSTSIFQADYIASENFKQINLKFLKYTPFISLKRLNDFDIEFVPSLLSLQMDSLDPLDP